MTRDEVSPGFVDELAVVLSGVLDALDLGARRGLEASATRRRVSELRTQLDALRLPPRPPREAA